jgi:hypothetical protein
MDEKGIIDTYEMDLECNTSEEALQISKVSKIKREAKKEGKGFRLVKIGD